VTAEDDCREGVTGSKHRFEGFDGIVEEVETVGSAGDFGEVGVDAAEDEAVFLVDLDHGCIGREVLVNW
jgi:hypothetical protein